MSDRSPVLYGNWVRPELRGVMGLSGAATGVLLVTGVTMMLGLMIAGAKGAVVVALLGGLSLVPLIVKSPKSGRTLWESVLLRGIKRHANKTGSSVLFQGPAGVTQDGQARLPGLLAASELIEATDAYGESFGLIHVPSTGHYTVVLEGSPPGFALIDQDQIDRTVAYYGAFLAVMGQNYPDVAGAQVSIETAPDPGVRLRNMLASQRKDIGQDLTFSDTVHREIEQTYPQGQAHVTSRVTLTFRSRMFPGAPKRELTEMVSRIGNALPAIRADLSYAGMGQFTTPMTAADITDAARVAYDPSVAHDVEQARAEGGTELGWDEAGPLFADDRDPHFYRHDRAWSTSWEMLHAPRSAVQSDILRSLLAPHHDIARKRVTLLYRFLSTEAAQRQTDEQVRNAEFVLNNNKQASYRDRVRREYAEQTAADEAAGAGMVRFGMIVTATVLDAADLPRAQETIRQLSAGAKLKLRPATWTQASTFAAGLPLGLVLPDHVVLPAEWKDFV